MLEDERRLVSWWSFVSWCEVNHPKAWLRIAILLGTVSCDQPAQQSAPSVRADAPDTIEAPTSTPINGRASLLGAWSADGQNFVWVIDSTTILFESDMQNHPYTLAGDTIVIDRGDPAIGVQKTRIVRLSGDTLVIQDVTSGTSEALVRLR